ncbi:MAG: hypothetical protein ABIN08_18270, partial [Caldimonas sp.]
MGDRQDRQLTRPSLRRALPFLLAASLLGLTAPGAYAHCERHPFSSTSVKQLRIMYLRCAEVSSRVVLDSVTTTRCSAAADELRDRGFNGSFEQLTSWWQLNRTSTIQSSAT